MVDAPHEPTGSTTTTAAPESVPARGQLNLQGTLFDDLPEDQRPGATRKLASHASSYSKLRVGQVQTGHVSTRSTSSAGHDSHSNACAV